MNATSGSDAAHADSNVHFAHMIQEEKAQVLLKKAAYDLDFPDNAGSLPLARLTEIARHRVVERLSRPPETTEVAFVADRETALFGMHIV